MKKIYSNKFVKYVFFALLTSGINILVYLTIYNYLIKSILISNIFAYTISIIVQFIINKNIVFKNNEKKYLKQGILFLLVKFISFMIDSLVLIICHNVFHLSNFWSKIISNSSTSISNYSLNNKLVFNNK